MSSMIIEGVESKFIRHIEGGAAAIWCVGCECAHVFDLSRWTISGTADKPTIRPSMLSVIENQGNRPWPPKYSPDGTPSMMAKSGIEIYDDGEKLIAKELLGKDGRCHYFVTEGIIFYLNDCNHQYRGKEIPLSEF